MKRIISLAALSTVLFCSCGVKFVNNYTVARIEHDGHDYITTIETEANYSINQVIEVEGAPFKVMYVNSTDMKW